MCNIPSRRPNTSTFSFAKPELSVYRYKSHNLKEYFEIKVLFYDNILSLLWALVSIFDVCIQITSLS